MRYRVNKEGVLGNAFSCFKRVFSIDSRAFLIDLQSSNLLSHRGIQNFILEL